MSSPVNPRGAEAVFLLCRSHRRRKPGRWPGRLGTIDLENGETLFRQGEPSTAVYLLISGEVQIRIEGPDQSPRTLVTLGPGAIIGEMGPLDE